MVTRSAKQVYAKGKTCNPAGITVVKEGKALYMKKGLLLILAPLWLMLVAGFSCDHSTKSTAATVYFWKTTERERLHHIYIDQTLEGVVPYLPPAHSASGRQDGLPINILPGHYLLQVAEVDGRVLSAGYLTVQETGNGMVVNCSWNNTYCGADGMYAN